MLSKSQIVKKNCNNIIKLVKKYCSNTVSGDAAFSHHHTKGGNHIASLFLSMYVVLGLCVKSSLG